MLDRRNDVMALRSGDRRARHEAGDQRVLGEILENSPAARVADQVRRPAEQDVEAPGPGLGADRRALPPRERQIPGGSQREIGRHGRRGVARPDVPRVRDAELGVGLLQRRNAEPRDSGDVAGRPDRSLRASAVRPMARRGSRRARETASPIASSAAARLGACRSSPVARRRTRRRRPKRGKNAKPAAAAIAGVRRAHQHARSVGRRHVSQQLPCCKARPAQCDGRSRS